MLVRFSLQNWASFYEKAEFFMVAGRVMDKREHLAIVPKSDLKLLPVAAIYGGNAAGKSQLHKAMTFVKGFVLRAPDVKAEINTDPYLLISTVCDTPTSFDCDILVEEKPYFFSFSVTKKEVVSEKLETFLNNKKVTIYSREKQDIVIDRDTLRDLGVSNDDVERINFVAKGTIENRLFLTNAIEQNVKVLEPVYLWFKDTLVLIGSTSQYGRKEDFAAGSKLHDVMGRLLRKLDTGIIAVDLEKIASGSGANIEIPSHLLRSPHRRLMLSRNGDETEISKLVSVHKAEDGQDVIFDFDARESEGTIRLSDILPAFVSLLSDKRPKVYFIDEINRSLHTLLLQKLLLMYLESRSKENRAQLIFTTHDLLLMDQKKLFRRDEMWGVERNTEGRSSLASFYEYTKVRKDKDLRKLYLQGHIIGTQELSVETEDFCIEL